MRLLLAVALAALVAGCSGRAPATPIDPAAGSAAEWFCQMSANGNDWDCVQDSGLARDPQPLRLPGPQPTPTPNQPLPLTPERQRQPDTSIPTPVTPADSRPAQSAATPVASPDSSAPDYVRLAYRPPQPMALTELPSDLYAVQLVAMSSKPALERYVVQEGIDGISAARVERDGELFFVLILGIYESADAARRAVSSLPVQFEDSTPWIRPLGSLQAAMLRADRLAGSTRF